MQRGLQLACEQCDFSATLYERLPFTLDADGAQTPATPGSFGRIAGYWTDSLCGECRLPVRVAHWQTTQPEGAVEVAVCPRCAQEPMPFESALRELAEACHSRAWVDLAVEREARQCLEGAIERAKILVGDVERGETTTSEALQQLAQQVRPEAESRFPARTPLADTHTLEGLGADVENAVNVEQAVQTLESRLWSSETYFMELESCVEEEVNLPGVPCPQCGTGHLVHWPVWF